MITLESMMAIDKNALREAAGGLGREDIPQLVDWLGLKDNTIRYQAFLLLGHRAAFADDVYPYWNVFRDKLKSDNSYQRSIGLMLLAENARWDAQNLMEHTIDEYLALLNDEKPITIRQCIQTLEKIVPHKPELTDKIAARLVSFDLMSVKETMRKSILLDIINILLLIRKELRSEEIEGFILKALSGEVLDRKWKKQIEAAL